MNDDCTWVTTGQRIVMVPSAIVGSFDEPFRLAGAGEPQTPAWLADILCLAHEDTSFEWRAIAPDRLDAVRAAIDAGCEGGCHCRCHQ